MPSESIPDAEGRLVRETDWVSACRRIVDAQREILAAHSGIATRTNYDGRGEGGDWALVIDRECEEAVFVELESLHRGGLEFTAVSEERGEVAFGSGESLTRIVIDPIDGSLNARRTIPSHCLSLAVASGPSMADVEFGYIYDFGAGEEFSAGRGRGVMLNGEPVELDALPEVGERLEVVGLEAAEPDWVIPAIDRLRGRAYRLRVVGSIAITLCYVAVGRFDAMLSARSCRSVDAAAGQLIVREAGSLVAFGDPALEDAALALDARYPVAAARSDAGLALVREAQDASASA